MPQDDRIGRLAQRIESRSRQEEHRLLREREIAALRRQAASQLHAIGADFADSVNRLLPRAVLEPAPPEYSADLFRDPGVNLMQIGAEGRLAQISFQATRELFSTEHFLTPYILDGELRTYNQEMLERIEIQSHALFFCVEHQGNAWRFVDWRTNRTGVVDREFLVTLFERLV